MKIISEHSNIFLNNDLMVILGGTFDPIHNGHIEIANILYETFSRPVIFMPNGKTNYKNSTNKSDRLNMLELALSNKENFLINTTELDNNNLDSSYKTFSFIRNKLHITCPILFFTGSDSFIELNTWDNWRLLFELVNFVVTSRFSYPLTLNKLPTDIKYQFMLRATNNFNKITSYGSIYLLSTKKINISSSMIRDKISKCQNTSNLLPQNVIEYIYNNNLYYKQH